MFAVMMFATFVVGHLSKGPFQFVDSQHPPVPVSSFAVFFLAETKQTYLMPVSVDVGPGMPDPLAMISDSALATFRIVAMPFLGYGGVCATKSVLFQNNFSSSDGGATWDSFSWPNGANAAYLTNSLICTDDNGVVAQVTINGSLPQLWYSPAGAVPLKWVRISSPASELVLNRSFIGVQPIVGTTWLFFAAQDQTSYNSSLYISRDGFQTFQRESNFYQQCCDSGTPVIHSTANDGLIITCGGVIYLANANNLTFPWSLVALPNFTEENVFWLMHSYGGQTVFARVLSRGSDFEQSTFQWWNTSDGINWTSHIVGVASDFPVTIIRNAQALSAFLDMLIYSQDDGSIIRINMTTGKMTSVGSTRQESYGAAYTLRSGKVLVIPTYFYHHTPSVTSNFLTFSPLVSNNMPLLASSDFRFNRYNSISGLFVVLDSEWKNLYISVDDGVTFSKTLSADIIMPGTIQTFDDGFIAACVDRDIVRTVYDLYRYFPSNSSWGLISSKLEQRLPTIDANSFIFVGGNYAFFFPGPNLQLTVSMDLGQTWQVLTLPSGVGCNFSVITDTASMVYFYHSPSSGRIFLAEAYCVVASGSDPTDASQYFQVTPSPAGDEFYTEWPLETNPFVETTDGTIFLFSEQAENVPTYYVYSKDGGRTWSTHSYFVNDWYQTGTLRTAGQFLDGKLYLLGDFGQISISIESNRGRNVFRPIGHKFAEKL